jgi:hypothetical protein
MDITRIVSSQSVGRQSGSLQLARSRKGGLPCRFWQRLSLFIQFCFAFHALKTGRPYWWIFVIMAFPVMGCLIYYFVEVFSRLP